MNKKEEFAQTHPEVYFLDASEIESFQSYLRERGWFSQTESILKVTKAGDGNMNCTLRVDTGERTLIVKQSRPWVEKYDHIEAPWDRALFEGLFFQTIAPHSDVANRMPELIGLDSESRVLAFEDLGESEDYSFLYAGETLEENALKDLAKYLSVLHHIPCSQDTQKLSNRDMRKLNHEHIFHLPLLPDNGLDLDGITPGLQELAKQISSDKEYVDIVYQLGQDYLEKDGENLLHGDFYPGSWLNTPQGVKVIDPEFGFLGSSEFDIGVMVAHLYLAKQPNHYPQLLLEQYREKYPLDSTLVYQLAGVEIMRRLLGVAQLPLNCDLEKKKELLHLSSQFVRKEGR